MIELKVEIESRLMLKLHASLFTVVFATNVDENCLLLVIFRAQVGVGVVKYYGNAARERIARQLQLAQERDPGAGLDLSVLNLLDTSSVFKRRA